MRIRHTMLSTDDDTLINIEKLRAECFNTEPNFQFNWYINSIQSGRLIPFGTYVDDELAASAFVEYTQEKLHITLIFTKPKFQETGLKLGRQLLKYIISNKKVLEEYFGVEINQIELSYKSEKSHQLYIKEGFIEDEYDLMCKTHRMYKAI